MKITREVSVSVSKQEMEEALKTPSTIGSLLNEILKEFDTGIYVTCDAAHMLIIFEEKETNI